MPNIKPIKIPMTLEIVTPLPQIEKMMLQCVRDTLNVGLPKVAPLVQKDLQQNIPRIFTKSREYDSLLNGPLNAHFGLEAGSEAGRLDEIIFTLARSIRVESVRVAVRGKRLTGGLRIGMFKADFTDLTGLQSALVYNKGVPLPWLEWLLLRGDQIIIADYEIDFADHPKSRSGEAVMVFNPSSVWRVPPGVSGTQSRNWITRAVNESMDFIIKLTTKSIDRHLDRIL
jgi:hypothetical protein